MSELVGALRDKHYRPMLRELQRLGILMDRALAAHPEQAVLTADWSILTLRQIAHRHVRHDERVVFRSLLRAWFP